MFGRHALFKLSGLESNVFLRQRINLSSLSKSNFLFRSSNNLNYSTHLGSFRFFSSQQVAQESQLTKEKPSGPVPGPNEVGVEKKVVDNTDIDFTELKENNILAIVKTILRVGKDEKAKKKASDPSSESKLDGLSMKRLLLWAKPEKKVILLSLSSLAITSSVSLAFPYVMKQILDIHSDQNLTEFALGLLIMFGVQSALIVVRMALLNNAGERMAAHMRNDVFKSMLSQDIKWFDRHRTGDLVTRISNDTTVIQKALTMNLLNGLRSTLMLTGSVVMLFVVSPKLAVLSLLVVPPVAMAGMVYGRFMQGQQHAVQLSLGKCVTVAEEALAGIRTVRQFVGEEKMAKSFATRVNENLRISTNIGTVAAYFDGAVHAAANLSIIIVLWVGGQQVMAGTLTAGDLTSFLIYTMYTAMNVGGISTAYTELKKAGGAAARLYEIMDSQPSVPLSRREDFWREADAIVGVDNSIDYVHGSSGLAATGQGDSKVPEIVAGQPLAAGSVIGQRALVEFSPKEAPTIEFRNVTFSYQRSGVDGSLSSPAVSAPGSASASPIEAAPVEAVNVEALKAVDEAQSNSSASADSMAARTLRLAENIDRPNVLQNFNLTIPSGKTVALVGSSGSGKSTVGAILTRLYDPQEGEVLVNDQELATIDPESFRRAVGVVQQEPILFAGTILDNIVYGRLGSLGNVETTQKSDETATGDRELRNILSDIRLAKSKTTAAQPPSSRFLSSIEAQDPQRINMDAVIEACKIARCHDFITSFPDGYLTRVGERGMLLSGGQKQRIAIARAIFNNEPVRNSGPSNPFILILDEATSALDSHSEALVQEALESIQNKRTTLTIAHRLSTMRAADFVAVMHNGAIIEMDSFDNLYADSNSHFRALIDKQTVGSL